MDIFHVINPPFRYDQTHQSQEIYEKGPHGSQILRRGHTVGSTFNIIARQDYVALVCWIPCTRL